jgi:collagenase-like PrtC family protease
MSKLTLGPLLFHWPADARRDFYFRVADEADIDCVYFGEVVCSKREPSFADDFDSVVDRLLAGGKEVVMSTLALMTTNREINALQGRCDAGFMVEANDVSCIHVLEGKPYVVGPFVNVFNEGALAYLLETGAKRLVMSMELPASSMRILAGHDPSLETEALVFGRQPLAVSMRCYHARANGLTKDSCQFVCSLDEDGLSVETLEGQPLLTVNGTQPMSHGYAVLLRQLKDLQQMGVTHFRLSPQAADMVRVARIYRDTLTEKLAPDEATAQLRELIPSIPFVNGYFEGKAGLNWVA